MTGLFLHVEPKDQQEQPGLNPSTGAHNGVVDAAVAE